MITKISVFCIWRDSEEHINKTLKQLENLESLSDFEFSFYFYENDSKDKTNGILSDWISKRKGEFLSEKLNAAKFGSTIDIARMKFLCQCRNKCKNLAKENDSDYSLLIDSDINFCNDNFLMQLDFLVKNKNAVMSTANVRQNIPDYVFGSCTDSYYDVYPFRDKHGNVGMYFSDCPSYKPEDQFDWKIGKPIRCMAAFGGFAIIRSYAFNNVKWSADLHCDHVNMCFDLSSYGEIYCLPRSKVYVDIGTDKINVSDAINNSKLQREHYEKFFV